MNDATTPTPRAKSKSRIDIEKRSVVITGGDFDSGESYDLGALPDNVMTFLAARGLTDRLSKAKDRAKEWAGLRAGTLPTERLGKPRPPGLADQAIACAVRDKLAERRGVKKSDKTAFAALLGEAGEIVAAMSKTDKATYKKTREVIGYIANLKATAAPQMSFGEE